MTTETTTSRQFPTFPKAVISGLAKRFVDLYAPIRETPEEFLFTAFITCFGSVLSPYVSLDSDSSEPRLFAVTLGRSARTKKSTANKLAKEFFRYVQKDLSSWDAKHTIMEGFASAEGLLSQLASEKAASTLVYLDEINLLAEKTSIQNSAGISLFHKLFEDHDYDHVLAQSSKNVRNCYLSLLGASTVDDFVSTWTGKHKDAGFFSRLLIVGSDGSGKRISRPVKPDQASFDQLRSDVRKVIDRYRNATKTELKLDADAQELWDEFYSSFGEEEEWNRIDTYGYRLMTIFALLDDRASVTREVVGRVIEFLKYIVAVRRLVAPVIAENLTAKVEELIRRQLQLCNKLSPRFIYRAINANRYGSHIFRAALNSLIQNGEAKWVYDGRRKYIQVLEPDTEDSTDVIIGADDTRDAESP